MRERSLQLVPEAQCPLLSLACYLTVLQVKVALAASDGDFPLTTVLYVTLLTTLETTIEICASSLVPFAYRMV